MKALLAALEKPQGAAEPTEDTSGGAEAAAQEIMDAIQAGDVAGLTAALKSFMDLVH